jgi:hypothetical protein
MKFQILRISANRTKRMKHVVPPNGGRPLNHRVRIHGTSFTQIHVLANNRVSSNLYPRANPRARRHNRVRMNLSLRFSLRAHKLSVLSYRVSLLPFH